MSINQTSKRKNNIVTRSLGVFFIPRFSFFFLEQYKSTRAPFQPGSPPEPLNFSIYSRAPSSRRACWFFNPQQDWNQTFAAVMMASVMTAINYSSPSVKQQLQISSSGDSGPCMRARRLFYGSADVHPSKHTNYDARRLVRTANECHAELWNCAHVKAIFFFLFEPKSSIMQNDCRPRTFASAAGALLVRENQNAN